MNLSRGSLRRRGRAWARPVSILIGAALIVSLGPAATAAPRDDAPSQEQVDAAKDEARRKAADVAAIQASLVVANTRVRDAAIEAEVAAEAWNAARWRLKEARKTTRRANAAVADAEEERATQRAALVRLVAQSYQDGSALNPMMAFFDADGPAGIMQRVGAVSSAAEAMQAEYDRYTAVSTLATLARLRAEKAQRKQQRLTDRAKELQEEAAESAIAAAAAASSIAARRNTLLLELAEAQEISLELATQRQEAMEQQARREQEAAARRKAQREADEAGRDAATAKEALDGIDGFGHGARPEGGWDLPGRSHAAGTTEGAARAIDFAMAHLGDPYLWGAAGPHSWDCSGLTMMAWRKGGVSLPHYSAAQYQQTKHITIGDLRPGDLLFWGESPNTIHHVALYIGNSMMLHAPRTGTVVRIESMYSWMPDFFGRP